MSKILRDLCIFAFIFAQLSSAITEEKEKEVPIQSPIPYHAYAMFVIWSFLVELPLLAIRNAKSATLHLLLFALLDLSTLGSVAFVTYYKWEKIISLNFRTIVGMSHLILGGVVPILIVLQHVLGFLTINKSATAKPVHKKLGVFIYWITKISVLTGAFMFDSRLFMGAVGWFVVLIAAKMAFSGSKKGKKIN